MNIHCGCECGCPVLLSIDDEIKKLEEHKKLRQHEIGMIDQKIAALKTAKES